MRILELSNHPAKMRREELERRERTRERLWEESNRLFEQRREEIALANQQAEKTHEAALARHRAEVERLRGELDALSSGMRWWRRWRSGVRLKRLERTPPRRPEPFVEPSPPPRPSGPLRPTDDQAKLDAGIEGEEMVAGALSNALGDEWTLLRGYRNRRGEVDLLLLGPGGLIAIEVKNHNATVHIHADEWRFEKFDNYGNLVKAGLITDRRARSPSEQLREPVVELELFLAKRGAPIDIVPVVMLSHPRAALGSYENLTVDVTVDVNNIIELARDSETGLEPPRVAKLEHLIVKDHKFHESRSGRRKRRSTPG